MQDGWHAPALVGALLNGTSLQPASKSGGKLGLPDTQGRLAWLEENGLSRAYVNLSHSTGTVLELACPAS